jgi:hypothetical protein
MVPEMKLYTVSLYTLYFNYAIQILTFNMVRLEVEMISTFMIYNDKKPVNNSSSWFDNFILSLLSSLYLYLTVFV